MKNFEEINRAQGAKKANNLKELRELRNQEKAIKARIDEISDKATNEAVAILTAKGLEKGEFEVEGVGKFQLPARTGGPLARKRQGESQRAEPRQSTHRRHERIRQDLRRALPRQGAGRDQVNGESNRVKERT